MRIYPITVAIRTLRGDPLPPRAHIPREQAIEWLRKVSGQDFGDNAREWTEWLKQNHWAYTRSPFRDVMRLKAVHPSCKISSRRSSPAAIARRFGLRSVSELFTSMQAGDEIRSFKNSDCYWRCVWAGAVTHSYAAVKSLKPC